MIQKQHDCDNEVILNNESYPENQDVITEPSTSIADFEAIIDFDDNNESSCLNIEVLHSSPPKEKEDSATIEKSYSCTLCSFSSQRESHFIKHSALHSSGRPIYYCDHCNFSSLSLTHLKTHLSRHQTTQSGKRLKCSSSNCNYSTNDSKLLKRHNRLKHTV